MGFYIEYESLIQRVVMTLLYSLGLGLILALFSGFVLLLTKNKAAALRYNLLTTLLFLYLSAVGIVFHNLAPSSNTQSVPGWSTLQHSGEVLTSEVVTINAVAEIAGGMTSFFLHYAHIIALAWLITVAFKTIHMARAIFALHYLKRKEIYPVGLHWERKVAELAAKIGVKRSVRLVQSGLVKIPMVMGHFKPVILIPLGAITHIPADDVEMILLHELAHIKRADFLVNLLQQLAELLFFFNPAVLWLSHLIRTERESCCDDMALAYSGSQSAYIRALLSFNGYQDDVSVYAMAFARETSLLDRVKRIAFGKINPLKFSEKVFLVAAIVLLCSFTLLLARVSAGQKLHKSEQKIAGAYPHKRLENHAQTELAVQKPSDMSIPSILAQTLSLDVDKMNNGLFLNSKMNRVESVDPLFDTLPANREEKILPPTEPVNLGFSKSLLSLQRMLSARRIDSVRMGDSLTRFNNSAHDHSSYKNYSNAKQVEFNKDLSLNSIAREHHKRFLEQVLDEIQREDVRYDRNRSKLYLFNDELIIDGVKQPAGVHLRIISKFLKQPEDKLDFIVDIR